MFSLHYSLRIPLVLLALLLLSACSATQIAYENADVLLTRYAAKELDLDRNQRERLSERLSLWLVWHRTEQLPVFHARLSALQRSVANGIDEKGATWLITILRGSYKEVLAGLNPISVDTLLTLSDEQIDALWEAFEEDNEEFREDVLVSEPQKRREERFDWFRSQLERWIGSVNKAQAEWLQIQLDRYPSTAEEWLSYRVEQQKRLLEMLRNGTASEALLDFLTGWMIERRGLPQKFARSRQRIYAELPSRLMELDAMLTKDQRRHLVKRIQFFEEVTANLILAPEVVASEADLN